MSRRVLAGIVAVAALTAAAGDGDAPTNLSDVVVWARRPVKDIGVTRTSLDSAMLRESVSLSVADVLAFNSSVYIKSYGRATLSTIALRGTSPGHTRVTWNGMPLNSPMLGSADLSTIPAYFVDNASLVHGSGALNETGGGPGGLVSLSTSAVPDSGLVARYVQGIGSFSTFDEFLSVSWRKNRFGMSSRVSYASSPNDFKYVNRDKTANIYDEDHNIVGRYHPVERNRNGSFKDFNALQEFFYDTPGAGRISFSGWYSSNDRELPMLSTDYSSGSHYENRQREQTVRAVAAWRRYTGAWRFNASAGYVHSWQAYDYGRGTVGEPVSPLSLSRGKINTFSGRITAEVAPSRFWNLSAGATLIHNHVDYDDLTPTLVGLQSVGYDRSRAEFSGSLAVRWQPLDRLGLSAVVRQETAGSRVAAPVPALFAEMLLWQPANIILKVSGSRVYKSPTLNDLYFKPGGNPDLRDESGWSYDASLGADISRGSRWRVGASVSWFDSYIDDWILWLPTTKGFFSPRNIRRVHAYGVEASLNGVWAPSGDWTAEAMLSYSWTPSVNCGDPISDGDRSVGKQLPYVPRHSASATATVSWRSWSLLYKWCYYSPRYTMTSNDISLSGQLEAYFMSNAAIEKRFPLRRGVLSVKLAVNNLFDADYVTVLSRPMPGINGEIFVGYTFR